MSTLKKRSATQSSYHHGDLTNSLKKNAFKIIKSKGISGLNLRDLAAKCGVSSTAVYRHYKSKEHLLASLAEEGFNHLQQSMLSIPPTKTAGAKVQRLGVAYIQFALQQPIYFQLMFGSDIEKTKFPSLLAANEKAIEILRSGIKQCIAQKMMVGSVDALTRAAWATVHGTALLLLDKQFQIKESEKVAIEITSIVARGLFRVD
jgi:AcrR family transcriptional regulator